MKRAVVLSALAIGLAPAHAAQVPLVDVAQLSARGSHACVVTTAGAAKFHRAGDYTHGPVR